MILAAQTVNNMNNTMMESHQGSMSMSDFQSLYHQHQGTPAGYFSPGAACYYFFCVKIDCDPPTKCSFFRTNSCESSSHAHLFVWNSTVTCASNDASWIFDGIWTFQENNAQCRVFKKKKF